MSGTPVRFDDVKIGDVLDFLTADNGFGGTGHPLNRTGTVVSKTDKTVKLKVGEGIPEYYLNSHGRGAVRMAGAHASIRRVDWGRREPRLVERATHPS